MDRSVLNKLSNVFWEKYYDPKKDVCLSEEEWEKFCRDRNVRRVEYRDVDWDLEGHIFEDFLIIPDPCGDSYETLYGFVERNWLEMDFDVALKILALEYI